MAVDVGVGQPTDDIRIAPAMSPERFDTALDAGRRAVENIDADLLVLGEMGIGNTTAAAAITAALLGGDITDWVGRGTGVDDEGLPATKPPCSKQSPASHMFEPLEILRHVGGAELVAIAGAIIARACVDCRW